LFFVRGRPIKETQFRELQDQLQEIEDRRNMLAHGLWVHEEHWRVIKFAGNVPDQKLHKTERKRKIRPEAFSATPEGLDSVLTGIESAIKSIRRIKELASSLAKAQ
jgi:hypothetical protein